jgi:hypothetical protein
MSTIHILLSVSHIPIHSPILIIPDSRFTCGAAINEIGNGGGQSSLKQRVTGGHNYRYGRPKAHAASQRPVPVQPGFHQ